ncbi:MAG: iron hydrogenase, partial [Candidatus Falkowbacteria bacterium]|nr:iron hydrogenase [Candidatus Falkowbacteria bacterium]
MPKALVISLEKTNVNYLTKLFLLLSIASIVPFFHLQPAVGPIVNTALFLATALLGVKEGILVSIIPSPIAFAAGLLPIILLPMIPFIILSNIILVYVFHKLWRKNYWLGMFSASTLKFIFLLSTSSYILPFLTKQAIAQKISAMMSWPQLFTAIAGGILAYGILKI